MTAAENTVLHQRMLEAFGKNDVDTLNEVFADDVVWHLPGSGMLAGDHSGKAAVIGFLGRAVELTGGTFNLELIDSAASDEGVYAWQRITGQRGGKSLDERELLFFQMAGGKVTEVFHRPDQGKLDEFFS